MCYFELGTPERSHQRMCQHFALINFKPTCRNHDNTAQSINWRKCPWRKTRLLAFCQYCGQKLKPRELCKKCGKRSALFTLRVVLQLWRVIIRKLREMLRATLAFATEYAAARNGEQPFLDDVSKWLTKHYPYTNDAVNMNFAWRAGAMLEDMGAITENDEVVNIIPNSEGET